MKPFIQLSGATKHKRVDALLTAINNQGFSIKTVVANLQSLQLSEVEADTLNHMLPVWVSRGWAEDVTNDDYNLPENGQQEFNFEAAEDAPRLNRYYFGVTLDHSDSEPIDFTFYCETLTDAWVELAQHLAVLGYKAVKMALWEADGE